MDYQVPSSELVQIVGWQRWFWRSWRESFLVRVLSMGFG